MNNFLFLSRSELEDRLSKYQEEVDAYTTKEVPRSVDDIRKVVGELEDMSQKLEQSKKDAMVSLRM